VERDHARVDVVEQDLEVRCARLVERGRELFGSEPLFVSEVGPVIGVYTGPGLLGVGGLPARFLSPAG